MLKTGIDIGSTTVKIVATDNSGKILFSRYRRHNANAKEVVANLMTEMKDHCGDIEADIKMTGSVGMGFSEKYGLPFVQEVVAATKAVQSLYLARLRLSISAAKTPKLCSSTKAVLPT